MKDLIMNQILIPSLCRLYQEDYDNIRWQVSERNICARLAHHMENKMREYDNNNNSHNFDYYYVDVEYNRMGNGDLKLYENSEKMPQYMVSDLLIQSRGIAPNLLAVEMKRKGNYKHVKEDKERLKSLVSSMPQNEYCVHDTLLGAFIVYSINEVSIDLFEDDNGQGILTVHVVLLAEYMLGNNTGL